MAPVIDSLHEFAREQLSDWNSSALLTVWCVVIEKGVLAIVPPQQVSEWIFFYVAFCKIIAKLRQKEA